jgi:3-dehydrosphinganine reductase
MKIKANLEPGRIALVTGGSSGIGKAIACGLAKRGMHVWLVAQREDVLVSARSEVESHRQSVDQRIGIISADISELDQVRKAVKQVYDQSGAVDLLVNAAGVAHPGYVQELDINIFKWMMETNYFGTVYVTKEVIPAMIQRGSGYIANISSGAAFIAYTGYSAYAASKFAVRGFSEVIRQEMKAYGIGVSVIFPSDTDTPQLLYENQFKPPETKALSSVGGVMSPQAVAQVILKGIERGKYRIIPDFGTSIFFHLNGISEDLVHLIEDRIIAGVQKKRISSNRNEA